MEIVATTQVSRFHVETLQTNSTEVDLPGFQITIGSEDILEPTRLLLRAGTHYCLIGRNGVGKSTLMRCIGEHKVIGFPTNIKTLYVEQEHSVGDEEKTILQAVLDADEDRVNSEQELGKLESAVDDPHTLLHAFREISASRAINNANDATMIASKRSGKRGKEARKDMIIAEEKANEAKSKLTETSGLNEDEELVKAHNMITDLYEKLSLMDSDTVKTKATLILLGLGFSKKQLDEPIMKLSGGKRMRVALARGLFMNPDILLLDEPTNHLDLLSVLWLVNYIKEQTEQTIVIVTHDRYLMNEVADEIILMRDKTLKYFPGDYNSYAEHTQQRALWKLRLYEASEKKKEHIHKSIQKAVSQAKSSGDDKRLGMVASRKKRLEKWGMEKTEDGKRFRQNDRAGFFNDNRPQIELEKEEEAVQFKLPTPTPLRYKGPILQLHNIGFSYSNSTDPKQMVFSDVTMNFTLKSRIAILGVNGSGKSTLLNLIAGNLKPTVGKVETFSGLVVAHFTQHHVTLLDFSVSPLKQFMNLYPGVKQQDARGYLGRFGISGALATQTIETLSGGQKSRVSLAIIMYSNPHVTNHMDLQSIEGLEDALRNFEGGIIVVGHDLQFIESVLFHEEAEDEENQLETALYVVTNKKVKRYEKELSDYIQALQSKATKAK